MRVCVVYGGSVCSVCSVCSVSCVGMSVLCVVGVYIMTLYNAE